MAKAVSEAQSTEQKEEKKAMTKKQATEIVNHYANHALKKDPAELKEAKRVLFGKK